MAANPEADKLAPEQLAERIRAYLLAEWRANSLDQWFYISCVHVPTDKFVGGLFIHGKGPTDAWVNMHKLGLCPNDCTTQTVGPIEVELANKIKPDHKWRLLTEDEVNNAL